MYIYIYTYVYEVTPAFLRSRATMSVRASSMTATKSSKSSWPISVTFGRLFTSLVLVLRVAVGVCVCLSLSRLIVCVIVYVIVIMYVCKYVCMLPV